ncbi:MAG: NADH-quinone oxidoreductase subunit N [Archaeoglobi archaeon]|jgi:NADH-quinone oxidoreductase subunit N|nr:MAG: NADH-quinone oxidoreductase subunit N [Archaeoglobi archaeon]TDA29057.1 MAG: NADH-quinone oxidoreductase subunit N [Archaeoglobi archaeon]
MIIFLIAILIAAFAAVVSYWNPKISAVMSVLAVLMAIPYSPFASLILAIAILNVVSLLAIRRNQIVGVDYAIIALMSLATVYSFITSNLAELLLLFIVVSTPTYLLVMIGEDRLNVEIGIKYVTFMVLATVLFIIGAVTLYHAHSTQDLSLYAIGFVALLMGLALEVGIAPLHEWVPDVFESANPIAVSVIASLAKFVPFIVAYKVLMATATLAATQILLILAVISAISMFIGNIGALTAKSASRILAYSTIANMGYILATFAAITAPKEFVYYAIAGGLLQLFVNAFGKIGFFNAVKDGSSSFNAYLLSFSFIGLPPLMGFWSKLFIIYALVFSNFLWLAIILVLNSAISVPYYLRLVRLVGTGWKFSITNTVTFFCALAMLVTLVPPSWFLELVVGGFR